MVDPIFTYVSGIVFLVLIIGSMLYLTFSTLDVEEGDENPGESVVVGVDDEESPSGEDDAGADPAAEEADEDDEGPADEAEGEPADEDGDEPGDEADG